MFVIDYIYNLNNADVHPKSLRLFFDTKVKAYNNPAFIKSDPISIPHLFSKKQDIEISGLFAAVFAWGNRTTIIQKSFELMQRMDMAPHDFVMGHSVNDLKKLQGFKHRTFTEDDVLFFIEFLHHHYHQSATLETAFTQWMDKHDDTIEKALIGFKKYFFSLEHLRRTRKHISSPEQNSSCKRLCMYLRWMVRRDRQGVDFGIWRNIKPSQLICPIDLHVARVAKRFGLMQRKQPDWQAALELTAHLRNFDKHDPVKYDFALFGLGVIEKYA
jgi:uncharacterized protein (TIGR02757 family)